MKRLFVISLLILTGSSVYCQRDTNLTLTRYVYSYDNGRRLPATDYKDKDAAFTLALYDANNDSIWNTPGTDMVIIAPYKADSVYTHIGCQAALINWHEHILMQAGKREYLLTFIEAGHGKINLRPITGKWEPPDAILFKQMPAITVTLLNGKTDSLQHILDKNKYTYFMFWGTWCKPCTKALNEMKTINRLYKKHITLISMDYVDADTNAVRKLVKDKGYNWLQCISDERTNELFSQSSFPYGILFAPNGKLVKQGMSVEELKKFLQHH